MRGYRKAAIIVIIALAFFMTACSDQKQTAEKATPERAKVENLATTPEDIKKEARDLADTTLSYADQQKLKYLELLKEKQEQYQEKYVELEEKLVKLSEQTKADMAAEMENLNRKKAEMVLKTREIQAASGKAFEDLREGMDRAIDEMDKAYDQALNRFQK